MCGLVEFAKRRAQSQQYCTMMKSQLSPDESSILRWVLEFPSLPSLTYVHIYVGLSWAAARMISGRFGGDGWCFYWTVMSLSMMMAAPRLFLVAHFIFSLAEWRRGLWQSFVKNFQSRFKHAQSWLRQRTRPQPTAGLYLPRSYYLRS